MPRQVPMAEHPPRLMPAVVCSAIATAVDPVAQKAPQAPRRGAAGAARQCRTQAQNNACHTGKCKSAEAIKLLLQLPVSALDLASHLHKHSGELSYCAGSRPYGFEAQHFGSCAIELDLGRRCHESGHVFTGELFT